MADGKKLFDFFELFRQNNGRFITKVDFIDEYTQIRGLASRGTLDSTAAWLLEKRRIVDGTLIEVEYADNANFTQTWDDRLASFASGNGSGSATGTNEYAISPVRVIEGEFRQSGLNEDMQVTVVTVTDTAQALPAAALVNRNSILIQNKDTTTTIYILNDAAVATSGANEGWEVDPQSTFSVDITEDIALYAIAPAGQSAVVKVLELA